MNNSILLIDDNPLNNSGYIGALEGHYNVDVAMRLVSAERLIKSRLYDIIIIDVMMPTQNLTTHDETSTGYSFYYETLKPMLKDQMPIILFWSRLEEESFNRWFGEHKPDNVFFLHKNEDEDHLLKKIELLLC